MVRAGRCSGLADGLDPAVSARKPCFEKRALEAELVQSMA